eukprot:6817594-Alexandrium_andersonii.AAC.1
MLPCRNGSPANDAVRHPPSFHATDARVKSAAQGARSCERHGPAPAELPRNSVRGASDAAWRPPSFHAAAR